MNYKLALAETTMKINNIFLAFSFPFSAHLSAFLVVHLWGGLRHAT